MVKVPSRSKIPSFFQMTSKIFYKELFKITRLDDFMKKKEYPVVLWIDHCPSVFDVKPNGRKTWNQVNGVSDRVDLRDSKHRHSIWQMRGCPHSPRTRRLKKMVMPLDCSSCWACSPVCTGRMGLAGVGSTSFVVTTRVVWRVTLKPSWVVLGNLLDIKSSRIRQREKGPEYQHTYTKENLAQRTLGFTS